MFWLTVNFKELIKQILWEDVRKPRMIAYLASFITPLQSIYDKTLYQMQHDGRTIYLEKVLNEWFQVAGYDSQNHETTKLVYIEDTIQDDKLYVHQDLELENVYLEDDPDNPDDLFLDSEIENSVAFSFIIFIPDTFTFNEIKVRALVDSYRYIGKKYSIQTYTL
mgnify:CR=1 FL=1